jgi:hypothetical protein
MMAFTRDWDEAIPTDSDWARDIDDYMRNLRVDHSDRLKDMVYGFIAGENTLNQHFQYIQFYEQASVSQPSEGYGRVYCKAVNGKCELFWQDEDGDEIQITSDGKFLGGSGTASQMLMWNTSEEDIDGGRESQIRAKGEQSGGEVTTLGYIEFSHDGSSDDEAGQIKLVVNDGDDGDVPSKVGILVNSDGTVTCAQAVTLADTSALASDAAPAADAQIANKKYVDDQITASMTPGAYAGEESVTFNNGLIMKFGTATLSGDVTTGQVDVTFGTAFPTAALVAFATVEDDAALATMGNISIRALETTGFSIEYAESGPYTQDVQGIHWMALGR